MLLTLLFIAECNGVYHAPRHHRELGIEGGRGKGAPTIGGEHPLDGAEESRNQ